MKEITILGSTGSIGTQTLDIVTHNPDKFRVVGLAAGSNVEILAQQVREFHPQIVAISNESKFTELQEAIADLQPQPILLAGQDGVTEVARYGNSEAVVTGIVGCAGLLPTIAAITAGKDIALANKETLIAGGPVVNPLVKKHGVKLLPADSEHSAIFQCLQGVPKAGLRRIILTASGGAFRDWPIERLSKVQVADAIKHPNWSMGKKITVDSATMMNKGLEVIEAHYLFGLDYDNIDIVVHPQSIIHSLIELQDTSVLAQLGWPDMRLPLLYALSWPERIYTDWAQLDLVKVGNLTFKEPDNLKYPCIQLAYSMGRIGGSMTAVFNAANEQAVALFLEEKISFLGIPKLIEYVCEKHNSSYQKKPSLDDILAADKWARNEAIAATNIGNNSLTSVNYSSKDKVDVKKNNLDESILELTENDQIQFNNSYQRGLNKYQAQDYESALIELDRAIEINPDHVDAYICRGNVKDKLEDYEGAIVDYNQAIQIDSSHSKAYHSRGNTLRKTGDHWGAIADYNKAIRLNPNYKSSKDRSNVYVDPETVKKLLQD